MGWPYIAAGAAALAGTWYSARSMRREAQKNREFQERMSSTAHERSVEDMKRAGINPMLAAGTPASTPSGATADVPDFGEGASKAVQSALAVKMARSQIANVDAQTRQADAGAMLSHSQAADLAATLPSRLDLAKADAALKKMTVTEKRALFGPAIAKAFAEIDQIGSASRAAKARARLDELAERGVMNAAEVEELISEFPEWARLFAPALTKLLTGGAAGAAAGALLRRGSGPSSWTPGMTDFVRGQR